MLKNDQTYIKILRCEYRNIFKVVLVFFDIVHEGDKQKALTINNDLKTVVCRCFFKTGVLKKFTIFTGKHLCWSLY